MNATALSIDAVLVQCNEAQADLNEGKLVRANGTLRTAIDILTKYIMKERLNVQEDVDLFSRLQYLQANRVITDDDFNVLDAVRKAGNDAIHSGVNHASVEEIRSRIASVSRIASGADNIHAAPSPYDDIPDTLPEKLAPAESRIAINYNTFAAAIKSRQTRNGMIDGVVGFITYLAYDISRSPNICAITINTARGEMNDFPKGAISAKDKALMETCLRYAEAHSNTDAAFDAAAELARRTPKIIARSDHYYARHNGILWSIIEWAGILMQCVAYLIYYIAAAVSVGGFGFTLLYTIGMVQTLFFEKHRTMGAILAQLRLLSIAFACFIGGFLLAVLMQSLTDGEAGKTFSSKR